MSKLSVASQLNERAAAAAARIAPLRWVALDLEGDDDLRPLLDYPSIERVEFQGAPRSLEPLTQLPELRIVRFDATAPDLEPLARCARLEDLGLPTKLEPAHVEALLHLPVRRIQIRGSAHLLRGVSLPVTAVTMIGVRDLSCLEGMRALEHLYVNGSDAAVGDLSPIASLERLVGIQIAGGKVYDLRPLRGLKGLERLGLREHRTLVELDGLESLHALRELDINLTMVESLEPLRGLPSLTTLMAREAPLTSLEPLLSCPRLEALYLERTKLQSIEGVGRLERLKLLWISATRVRDLEPLRGHRRLEELDASELSPLRNAEAIATLRSLRVLDMAGSEVDSRLLVGLDKLEEVRGVEFPPPDWSGQRPQVHRAAPNLGPGTVLTGVAHSIQLPSRPRDIAPSPDGTHVAVALEEGGLWVVRLEDGEVVERHLEDRLVRSAAYRGSDHRRDG